MLVLNSNGPCLGDKPYSILGLFLQENGIVRISKYPHVQFTSKYTAKFECFWQYFKLLKRPSFQRMMYLKVYSSPLL